LAPEGVFGGGGFIDDDEIEADAAEGIGVEGADDGDGGAPEEIDAAMGLVGLVFPIRAGEFFEAIPGDAAGVAIVRADIPTEAAGAFGGVM
jgi:hypothetical protein